MLCSHIWDWALKILTFFPLIVFTASRERQLWELWPPLNSNLGMAAVFAIVIFTWIILYRQFVSILASWLYARFSLRTKVSLTEGKMLRKLFQLDMHGKWIPMVEVLKLPAAQRHDALMKALEE